MASEATENPHQDTLESHGGSEPKLSEPSKNPEAKKATADDPPKSSNGNKKANAYSEAKNASDVEFDELLSQWGPNAVSTDEEDKKLSETEKIRKKIKKLQKVLKRQEKDNWEPEKGGDDSSADEMDWKRATMLKSGGKSAINNIEGCFRETPPEFLDEYRKAYTIIRRLWHNSLTEDHKKKLDNINEKIKEITENNHPDQAEDYYLFPWRDLGSLIEGFKMKYNEFKNSEGETRKKAATEILNGTRQYEVALLKKGIPFKMLIPKDIVSLFIEVLQTPEAKDFPEEFRSMFTRPTPYQLSVLEPAEQLVPKFVKDSLDGNAKRANNGLKKIEELNKLLRGVNKKHGLAADDHTLPEYEFQLIMRDLRDEEQTEEDTEKSVRKHLARAQGRNAIAGFPFAWIPDIDPNLSDSVKEAYTDKLMNATVDIEIEEASSKEAAAKPRKTSAETNKEPQTNDRKRHRSPSPEPEPMDVVDKPAVNTTRKQTRNPTQGSASLVSSKFRPKYSAFFGPEIKNGITPYGKIVQIRKAGRGLYRACVNVGTDELPYYFMRPSSDFPKGVIEELYPKLGNVNELPPDTTSYEVIYATCLMVGKAPESGKRAAPQWLSVRTIQDPDKDYFTTISGLGSIIGQSQARRMRDEVKSPMEEVKEALLKSRELNEHPETGEPLSETDRSETPWLFSDAPDPWASNGGRRVWSPPIRKRKGPGDLSDDLSDDLSSDNSEEEEEEEAFPPPRVKAAKNRNSFLQLKKLMDQNRLSAKDLIAAFR